MTRCIAITALLTYAAVTGVAANSGLGLSQDYFNFGYVPQDAKVTHVFWLKSTGDDSLRIAKVVPGCACAKAPLDKDVIAPGDSARLEIIFSTGKYNGAVSKRPAIYTTRSAEPAIITIHSTVLTNVDTTYPIIVSPYVLDIAQFGDTIRDELLFSVNNVSDQTVGLRLIAVPEEFFEVDLPDKIKPGESAQATITVQKSKLGTSFEKSFTFELNNEQKSRFTLPVTRELRYPPKTSPATLPPR
jgi:hypothetical protein